MYRVWRFWILTTDVFVLDFGLCYPAVETASTQTKPTCVGLIA
jgi:hypothetical protein